MNALRKAKLGICRVLRGSSCQCRAEIAKRAIEEGTEGGVRAANPLRSVAISGDEHPKPSPRDENEDRTQTFSTLERAGRGRRPATLQQRRDASHAIGSATSIDRTSRPAGR